MQYSLLHRTSIPLQSRFIVISPHGGLILRAMRWITSRWSTNPYYALVIAVIACGGIPKGTCAPPFTGLTRRTTIYNN
ncbi:hypothetical protein ACN38_g3794 [Penicillium nordicum]|uniref:Uncharacterized protein n=1 Tax=Penicillium nordicum TaxID=229535 RepID=A0A0M9WHN5_9EURO|nr:hypothetical protein ACN38_g3794 [Penicillium nordicum]